MLPTLILIVFVLLVAGVLHYLVGVAPIVAQPYKAAIQWIILAVAAVWVIFTLYHLVQGLG